MTFAAATGATAATAARALYDHYAARARLATADALPTGEPRASLYDLLPWYVRDLSAKHLRPVLCLASCVAHGGTVEDALPAAVGLEMLHNAFLIHDDIEDDSRDRRGRQSLPARYGMELALNAGDTLAAHAQHFVAERCSRLGARVSRALNDEFHRAVRETVEGQAIELGWRQTRDELIDAGQYVTMIAKKTAWYSAIAPVRIGAVIATGGRVDLEGLTSYGSLLGVMYQVRNDLANLDPDYGDDGHQGLADLLERKATLPLVYLLDPSPPLMDADRQIFRSFYLRRGRSDTDVSEAPQIVEMMRSYGCMKAAEDDFWELARAADARAAETFTSLPDTAARHLLERIPRMVRARVTANPPDGVSLPGL